MNKLPETLRDNVRLLGDILGEILLEHEGPKTFQKIEEIRALSKLLNSLNDDLTGEPSQKLEGGTADSEQSPLVGALSEVEDKDILPIARAFNQFLNLANIADLEYFSSVSAVNEDNLDIALLKLTEEFGKDKVSHEMENLHIELVLTAHPTEVARRTLIRKYEAIANTLQDYARDDLLQYEKDKLNGRLKRLIEEIWHTDEIRTDRPTAVDEAKWGFNVIENSLWTAVPDFLRHVDRLSRRRLGKGLDLDARPIKFFSWMGGDRDGNPNVTSDSTQAVLVLGRQRAASLYLKDISALAGDLSMHNGNQSLLDYLGSDSPTPYRELMLRLMRRLESTIKWTVAVNANEKVLAPDDIVHSKNDLLDPLILCYQSLTDIGLSNIANGPLLDTIRRVNAFGINLLPLDIRQDSERHLTALDEITQYLGLGSYAEWSEEERQEFLLRELQNKRPLLPKTWEASEETKEVLATCAVIANHPEETLSTYIISMAQQASDVLAVALLLKESGVTRHFPIVPLFETLDDLNRSAIVMEQLWSNEWYSQHTHNKQTIMIGYSDSAKDAGKFAATWALYKAQENLVHLAEDKGVELCLFHGRGGTVGRGGGPVEKAMASQPPGSVRGRVRVTEQGEMIRYKFGLSRVAFRSLSNYMVASMQATIAPSPPPKQDWRDLIEEMSEASLLGYRQVVREHKDFVPYFRTLTPEQELSKLALGSRPARRKASGGVESLRAIPWVFAWTQVRLNLPGWLGTQQAITYAQENKPEVLQEMLNEWPFFASFIDLLEMVVGKANANICDHYEKQLVPTELHSLGETLRQDLLNLEKSLNALKDQPALLEDLPILQMSLNVREPYIAPLNYLQAELLKRERKVGEISQELEQALKVTMAGIAAGMRNTG